MQNYVESIQLWVHEVVATNVGRWYKVAVRVNSLFVPRLHDMYGCSGWPSFVAVKSGTKITSVLDFPTSK